MNLSEIVPGVVVFLDPNLLRQEGVPCPIVGRHPFVCLEVGSSHSLWVPLTSKPGLVRFAVPAEMRCGRERWCERPCFIYHYVYCWWVHNWAVQGAAEPDWRASNVRDSVSADGLRWIRQRVLVPRTPPAGGGEPSFGAKLQIPLN